VSPLTFGLNFDYRCPFGRIIHEHVVHALKAGADFAVSFEPYTLSQGHIPPGNPACWDDPTYAPDLLSLEVGLVVRDHFPEQFLDTHLRLYTARHDEGNALRTEAQIAPLLEESGVDPDAVFERVATGKAKREIAEVWTKRTSEQQVFGVPTFFVGDAAVFIRYMERATGDAQASTELIAELVSMIERRPQINEFKHTTIAR
jgi:hypothetical protein